MLGDRIDETGRHIEARFDQAQCLSRHLQLCGSTWAVPPDLVLDRGRHATDDLNKVADSAEPVYLAPNRKGADNQSPSSTSYPRQVNRSMAQITPDSVGTLGPDALDMNQSHLSLAIVVVLKRGQRDLPAPAVRVIRHGHGQRSTTLVSSTPSGNGDSSNIRS